MPQRLLQINCDQHALNRDLLDDSFAHRDGDDIESDSEDAEFESCEAYPEDDFLDCESETAPDSDAGMDLAVGAEEPPAPFRSEGASSVIAHCPRPPARPKRKSEPAAKAAEAVSVPPQEHSQPAADSTGSTSQLVAIAAETAAPLEHDDQLWHLRSDGRDGAPLHPFFRASANVFDDLAAFEGLSPHEQAQLFKATDAHALQACDAGGDSRPHSVHKTVRFTELQPEIRIFRAERHERDITECGRRPYWKAGEDDSDDSDASDDADSGQEDGTGPGTSSHGRKPDDKDGPEGSGGSGASAGTEPASDDKQPAQTQNQSGSSAPASSAAGSAKQHSSQPPQPSDSTLPMASMLAACTPGLEDGDACPTTATASGYGTLHADWTDQVPVAVLALGVAVTGYLLGSDLPGAGSVSCHTPWLSADLVAGWMV